MKKNLGTKTSSGAFIKTITNIVGPTIMTTPLVKVSRTKVVFNL